MKARILIFTTIFLVGNISFATQIVSQESINRSEKNSQSHTRRSLQNDLKNRLVNRGLDEEYADELAESICEENEVLAAIKMHHYLTAVQSVSYDDFMQEIASRALFKKNTDLNNYDTLVGLTQTLKGHHIDEETLKKLSTVAIVNQNLQFIS